MAFHSRLKYLNKRGSVSAPRRTRAFARNRDARIVSSEYLAGFLDAEGCLMIAKVSRSGPGNPRYGARVCIGNTDRAILEDVQRRYGGILADQPARKAGWKDAYQLIWTGRRVEGLLKSVGPHLRIKRNHARVLLQFIGHKEKTRQGRAGRGFAPLPGGVIAYREGLHQRMRELNAKGPPLGQG